MLAETVRVPELTTMPPPALPARVLWVTVSVPGSMFRMPASKAASPALSLMVLFVTASLPELKRPPRALAPTVESESVISPKFPIPTPVIASTAVRDTVRVPPDVVLDTEGKGSHAFGAPGPRIVVSTTSSVPRFETPEPETTSRKEPEMRASPEVSTAVPRLSAKVDPTIDREPGLTLRIAMPELPRRVVPETVSVPKFSMPPADRPATLPSIVESAIESVPEL